MEIRDLGRLDGPVLLYGGAVSNAHAAAALFARADALGVPVGARICTGDIAAYCADPLETAELVLARGGTTVAGNCERQLGAMADACGCGFGAGTACDLLSRGWYAHATAALADRPDLRAAFAAMPDMAVFTHRGRRFAVIHGGVTDIARFLWPVSREAAFRDEIAAIEALVGPVDGVVAGHAGLAFIREVGGRLWVNAGSVGMPPHDGGRATRFSVLEAGRVRIERLDYDAEGAAAAMRAAGLTQGYDAALLSGFWPSEDILPVSLRRPVPADGAR